MRVPGTKKSENVGDGGANRKSRVSGVAAVSPGTGVEAMVAGAGELNRVQSGTKSVQIKLSRAGVDPTVCAWVFFLSLFFST